MIGYAWQIVSTTLGLHHGGAWMNNEMNVDGWVMDDIPLGQLVSDLRSSVPTVSAKIKAVQQKLYFIFHPLIGNTRKGKE